MLARSSHFNNLRPRGKAREPSLRGRVSGSRVRGGKVRDRVRGAKVKDKVRGPVRGVNGNPIQRRFRRNHSG